ncbi:Mobile element protein [Azospirillum argentinense]
MPLPGGAADKAGNRYELMWTVMCIIEVMQDRVEHIRIEPPGSDGDGTVKSTVAPVADQVRPKLPKLATLLDEAEEDVLAFMTFPKEHRAKIHTTDEIDKSRMPQSAESLLYP